MTALASSYVPVPLRDRLCDAASALLVAEGWGRVTMARLATEVGVSRQTVYNEIGTKNDLAEAIVLRELDLFLAGVTKSFEEFPSDLTEAIRAAARRVLKYATDNAVLHAVVSANHGADTELLPLLTTNSASLLEGAKAVVRAHVSTYDVGLSDRQVEVGVDLIVRLVLSHVMQPGGSPDEVADDIAWVVGLVLA
ncbi:MAG: TetR family transcriptional regulator [Nocardioidaceae bacterium]|nr:TetR family transcriptional regulator [Nocardioidaceae bacterium]MCL2614704.1 TetR family transcriptional regulator [Nocardioidaceae bacterium]